MAVIFYCLRKPRQVIVIRDYLKIRPDMPLIVKIMAIGIPAGVENSMFQFGKLAIQSTVSTMGECERDFRHWRRHRAYDRGRTVYRSGPP